MPAWIDEKSDGTLIVVANKKDNNRRGMATFFMVRPNLTIIPQTKNPTNVGLDDFLFHMTYPYD